MVPILEPDKPKDLSTSCRPISRLCPVIKTLERLILPRINSQIPLPNFQHGFRPLHSTTSALLPLTTAVADGFNGNCPPCRTVVMSLDLSKAFDLVDHTLLLSALNQSALDHNTVRWLATWLRGRTASCRYNKITSSQRAVKIGIPLGSVIPPPLFNFYCSTYPETCPLITSYADDFTSAASDTDPQAAADVLSNHATDVAEWAESKKLRISAPKSSVTLFTPQTQQVNAHPTVTLNWTTLPLNRNPPHSRGHL